MYYENVKKRHNFFPIILIFLAGVVGFLISFEMNLNKSFESDYSITKTAIEPKEQVNIESLLKKTTSCVVGISKLEQSGTSIFLKNVTESLGMGSGVIVSENGYILTNEHVAGNKYSNCYVTLENGRSYNGDVIWSDSNIDLAILKIDAYKLDYLELADSDNIFLGQDVYAIGNPVGFEFQRTVTKGIVSGINRTLKIDENENSNYMEDLIQTDSTINQGNSGGPLINENGKIIGINTIKIDSAEGMGFAVPVNIVKPIFEKLMKDNKFEEAYLGIFGYDREVIPYLSNNLEIERGIYIAKVVVDGPAKVNDIKEGDIIVKIDDYEVNKMNDLKRFLYQKNPGDTVKLSLKRGNKEIQKEIILTRKL